MPAPFDTGEISIEAEEFTPKATLEYVFDDSLAWFTYSNGWQKLAHQVLRNGLQLLLVFLQEMKK